MAAKARQPEAVISDPRDGLELNVTPKSIANAREFLIGRIKRLIEECGHSAYEAGHIAGTIADLKALDALTPLRPDTAAPAAPLSPEDEMQRIKRAERAHNREEERALGRDE